MDNVALRITNEVATRIAIEARAGFPQGLTDRRFEDITAELIMADWEHLAANIREVDCVRKMCGLNKTAPVRMITRDRTR